MKGEIYHLTVLGANMGKFVNLIWAAHEPHKNNDFIISSFLPINEGFLLQFSSFLIKRKIVQGLIWCLSVIVFLWHSWIQSLKFNVWSMISNCIKKNYKLVRYILVPSYIILIQNQQDAKSGLWFLIPILSPCTSFVLKNLIM